MEPLLFLAHRLPYPPNKGDKVRSFHVLRHLAGRYRVFLATFVDDPADWQHVEALRRLCADLHVEPLSRLVQRARSTACLLRGEALSLGYFRSPGLKRWVDAIAGRERISRAYVFSSPMAQYVADLPRVRSVVDFVDMDSEKWGQYASRRPWPLSTLYRREAARLLEYERETAGRAEAGVFVTDEEAALFLKAAPECASRVVAIRNGVDSEYFSPSYAVESPFAVGEHAIVFTGAMDYWPNADAVAWFARDVLPEVRRRDPLARFYIVGMNPDSAVRALASNPGTVVTGRVDDVRPYLRHARVVVAPLRVARGIQNKVLEAMAMAKAVVATPPAVTALSARQGSEVEVAAGAAEFADKVVTLMDPVRARRVGESARARILVDYAWTTSYARFDELLERGGGAPGAVTEPGSDLRCTLAAS